MTQVGKDLIQSMEEALAFINGEGSGTSTTQTITCSSCGMTFEGITSYYCTKNDCPTFMKAT